MREAMKLNADDIKIIFAADVAMTDIQLQCLQSQQIVSFDSSISHSLTAEFSTQLITTLGPEVLLKDAAKKKITWADLQQVMKRL